MGQEIFNRERNSMFRISSPSEKSPSDKQIPITKKINFRNSLDFVFVVRSSELS